MDEREMMRHYLDDDDKLIVNRNLACAMGLNESIVIRQLFYWLKHNKQDKDKRDSHLKDDCWWTYNTYDGWQKDNFQFWSYDTVRRTFLRLEEMGLVYVANYNKKKGDQTKWYTINYSAYDAYMLLWMHHQCPSAGNGKRSASYAAFLEDWNMQKSTYTNLASCVDQFGKLQTPSVQVAKTVTRDYTEITTEKKKKKKDAPPATQSDAGGSKVVDFATQVEKQKTRPRDLVFDQMALETYDIQPGQEIPKQTRGHIAAMASAARIAFRNKYNTDDDEKLARAITLFFKLEYDDKKLSRVKNVAGFGGSFIQFLNTYKKPGTAVNPNEPTPTQEELDAMMPSAANYKRYGAIADEHIA